MINKKNSNLLLDQKYRRDTLFCVMLEHLKEAQSLAKLGFWEWDLKNNNLSRASEELCRIFGISLRSDFTSDMLLSFIHLKDRVRVKKTIENALKNGEPFEISYEIIAKDGKKKFLVMTGKVTRIKDNKPEIMHGTIRDMTNIKRMEKQIEEHANNLESKVKERTQKLQETKDLITKEKNKLNVIFKSMGEGIIVMNKEGIIELANDKACSLLGWEKNEIIGKNYFKIVTVEVENGTAIPEEERSTYKALKNGKSAASRPGSPSVFFVKKNGSKFPIFFNLTPVFLNGKFFVGVLIFSDASSVVAIDRVKSEFVSMAAHQLRTPLSVISMYSELLDNHLKEQASYDEECLNYINEIHSSIKTMTEFINDLLNVSRIDADALDVDFESLDTVKLMDSVSREFASEIERKGLILEKHYEKDLPLLKVDRNLTRNVLENLLANAIKYTPKGKIKLSVKKEGKSMVFSVSDTGYGIPEKQQSEIFKKMFRAENIKNIEPNGMGLGLYIVKSFADRMGGTINFTSKENEGTTFFCVYQLNLKLRRKKACILKSVNDNKKMLIVEDEISISRALDAYFKREKFEVFLAKDGEEGLKVALDCCPSVILLDLLMPKMDGVTMLKNIFENDKTGWSQSMVPIVLSNLSYNEKRKEAKKIGIKFFLVKSNTSLKDVKNIIEYELKRKNNPKNL